MRVPADPAARRRQWIYRWVALFVGGVEGVAGLIVGALHFAGVTGLMPAVSMLATALAMLLVVLPLTLAGHTIAARNAVLAAVTVPTTAALLSEPSRPHVVGGLASVIILASLTESRRYVLVTSLACLVSVAVPLAVHWNSGATMLSHMVTLLIIASVGFLSVASATGVVRDLSAQSAMADELAEQLSRTHEDLEAGVRERTRELALRTDELERTKQDVDDSLRRQEALEEELARLSVVDDLTGLTNRRGLMAELARSDEDAWLFIVDVDHFKRVNDRLGHDVGDEVLSAIARLLAGAAPAGACVARIGGEEFAVLASGAPDDRVAEGMAQAMLDAIGSHDWSARVPGLWSVTVSCGGAHLRLSGSSRIAMREADESLYRAKAEGRARALLAVGHGSGAASSR